MAETSELRPPSTADVDNVEAESDAARISEVQTWLKSMFKAAGKEIPEFEHTPSAVAHLHNVARISQARTNAAQLLRTDLQEKTAEYRSQAVRVRELLDGMGLAFENLSQDAISSIKIIGTVANSLNIKDTEPTSLLIGMGDLLLRKIDVQEQRAKVDKESNELLKTIRKAITHLTHLKRTAAELEEVSQCNSLLEHIRTNLKIMESKEHQYMVQLANYKALLSRLGHTPEISHGVLIQLHENRKELEKKTMPILNTLRSYQDLPPDKTLAELVIEHKKREFEAAERYLEDVLHSALSNPSK